MGPAPSLGDAGPIVGLGTLVLIRWPGTERREIRAFSREPPSPSRGNLVTDVQARPGTSGNAEQVDHVVIRFANDFFPFTDFVNFFCRNW